MADDPRQVPTSVSMQISPEVEVGVFADFASIWHTPNTFVLDFLSIRRPAEFQTDDATNQPVAQLETTVGARVRIPPEQIFKIIEALQVQGQQWLAETGRSEPPQAWLPGDPEPNRS